MNHEEQRKWLIQRLLDEDTYYKNYRIPEDEQEQKDLLRSLMNVRMPQKISQESQILQSCLRQNQMIRSISGREI